MRPQKVKRKCISCCTQQQHAQPFQMIVIPLNKRPRLTSYYTPYKYTFSAKKNNSIIFNTNSHISTWSRFVTNLPHTTTKNYY